MTQENSFRNVSRGKNKTPQTTEEKDGVRKTPSLLARIEFLRGSRKGLARVWWLGTWEREGGVEAWRRGAFWRGGDGGELVNRSGGIISFVWVEVRCDGIWERKGEQDFIDIENELPSLDLTLHVCVFARAGTPLEGRLPCRSTRMASSPISPSSSSAFSTCEYF